MAFKMKGSPMARNYGIGKASPLESKVNTNFVDADGNGVSDFIQRAPDGTKGVADSKKSKVTTGKSTKKTKGTDYKAMQAKSAKNDARYGKMSASEYKAEVTRQVKSKKKTGSYDAMGTEAKAKKAETKLDVVVIAKENTPKVVNETTKSDLASKMPVANSVKSKRQVSVKEAKGRGRERVKANRKTFGRGSDEVKAAKKAKRESIKLAKKNRRARVREAKNK